MKGLTRSLALVVLACSGCMNKSCEEEAQGPVAIIGTRESRILSPFPSDRLTLSDPTQSTGLRVDLPLPLPTGGNQLETKLVEQANKLDGFGTFAPLCVRFDRPLDLSTVTADRIYLMNVSDGSRVPLDIGTHYYPPELTQPAHFFPNDPQYPSLLFPPNNRVSYYEDETNCLILRPTVPLQPASRYVVLLSRAIRGLNGRPIESPEREEPNQQEFDDAIGAMAKLGLAPTDVGFYWNFTTQSISGELEAIRAGLDRQGKFSWLPQQFPPQISVVRDLEHGLTDGDPYTFDADFFGVFLKVLYQLMKTIAPVYPNYEELMRPYVDLFTETNNLDYFIYGTIPAPNFGPTFQLDLAAGTAQVSPVNLPFMLSVPKPSEENGFAQPPYPVVVFGHGLTASRLMSVVLANRLAARGLAVLCTDLPGHGPLLYDLPKNLKTLGEPWKTAIRPLLFELGLLLGCPPNPLDSTEGMVDTVAACGLLGPISGEGRAIDLNGDGLLDPAAGFFSSDFFQTRDSLRQSVVELMHTVRVVRALGQDWNRNGQLDREEGDFDQNGVLDVGGPILPVTFSGMSLGSILGGILMGVDPLLRTGVLNVGGGGLSDLFFRTSLLDAGFLRHVVRDVFGLAVVGEPKNGQVQISFNDTQKFFWSVPVSKDIGVQVRNVTKDRVESVAATAKGAFQVINLCDAGDDLEITVTSGKNLLGQHKVKAPVHGLGLWRGTPRTREMFMLLEWFLERGDPVCYAPLWWERPLTGVPKKNVLFQFVASDTTVNISAGISLARAAGVISPQRMAELVKMGIVKGDNIPIDTLLPVEANRCRASRFHTGGSHVYIIGGGGDGGDTAKNYARATQDQVALFCTTDGETIVEHPIFPVVIPFKTAVPFQVPVPWKDDP